MSRKLNSILFVMNSVFLFSSTGFSQDSLKDHYLSKEIVVSATRYERLFGTLPVPVSLVSKKTINLMGSMRLHDVLIEQTGLTIVPNVLGQGSGLQLQGFNPEYTLILLDGEPFVGRIGGSLDISRIALKNIKKVEILKGPSSSLYGSEALAGVINIITETPVKNNLDMYTRYGTNNTSDLNINTTLVGKKSGLYLFGNRHSTDGYKLNPKSENKTVSPFFNYTLHKKLTHSFSPSTRLVISSRWFTETQNLNYKVLYNQNTVHTSGHGKVHELNINPYIIHSFSPTWKTTFRYYHTQYKTNTELFLPDGTQNYEDMFFQKFLRPEIMAEHLINKNNILTLGAGWVQESVQTSRYGGKKKRTQNTYYGYIQHEWHPFKNTEIISGLRLDRNSIFGGQISPKLSSRYEINSKIALKGSIGVGFKSPDFKQLYYNFANQAAGGYLVLGVNILNEKLDQWKKDGLIEQVYINTSTSNTLKPETSIAINTGSVLQLPGRGNIEINMFMNWLNNLIETQQVALTTARQTIYSYQNISRVLIYGLEFNFSKPFLQHLRIDAGYQLLYAKDRDVIQRVHRGEVFYRDPETLITKQLQPSEYFGLYNRSRHQGNIKLFYHHPKTGWGGSLRTIYRSAFGSGGLLGNIQGENPPSSDRNSNAILDKYDQFINGYLLFNISASKSIKNTGLRLQVGVENGLNYTQPLYLPNIPGRLYFLSIQYSLPPTYF